MFRFSLKSKCLLKSIMRNYNLQEFQSKEIMRSSGISVQDFRIASSLEEAASISSSFKSSEYVIKAQILAGGRGKGEFSNGFKGGVKLTPNANDIPELVSKMLGHRLRTKQTSANGVLVNQVMVAEAVNIVRESYVAFLLDRSTSCPVLVYSREGGVDIEEVAAKRPDAVFSERIDAEVGIMTYQLKKVATLLGYPEKSGLHEVACQQLMHLYRLFSQLDCTQVEINPFAETDDNRLVCVDAKFEFDPAAMFRHSDIQKLIDANDELELESCGPDSLFALEMQAKRLGISYLSMPSMSGNIGCMVNGAGLAMATMDIVKLHGGEPANFLDLGGGVTEKQVEEAIGLLVSDKRVSCILINIFGGIVNCSAIAKGIVNSFGRSKISLPTVVRLEGTASEEAAEILAKSGIPLTVCTSFDGAAKAAVEHSNAQTNFASRQSL